MKSFVALCALIVAVCVVSGQCRSARNRNTNINTNTNTNTNGDFLSSYLNSMLDQERKGKAVASQKQVGSTVLCLVCPKCCKSLVPDKRGGKNVPISGSSPATAMSQAQQEEDQQTVDENETPSDDSIAEEASFDDETLDFAEEEE